MARLVRGCLVLAALAGVRLCFQWSDPWASVKDAHLLRSEEHLLPSEEHLLPSEEHLSLGARHVLVMHHKRLNELNATLRALQRLPKADQLNLTVVQSLEQSEADAANATSSLIRSLPPRPQLSIRHLKLFHPSDEADGSYSVDARRYGTKRNSFRNLLHGLDALFLAQPALRSAIVIEDDALLAQDALEFFEMAASVAASTQELPLPHRVVLATTICFLRDDHEDYYWWRYSLARKVFGGANRYYYMGPLRSSTVKTFAWLITAEVYEAMRHDVLSGPEPMLDLPADAPLHHSLVGCSYCENFCYDHYLEWRWRNASFLCPAVPRARANFSGGMTERAGLLAFKNVEGHHARQRAGVELNAIWTHSSEFVEDSGSRTAARVLHHLMQRMRMLAATLLLCICFLWRHWRTLSHKVKRDDECQHERNTHQVQACHPHARSCLPRMRRSSTLCTVLLLLLSLLWMLLSIKLWLNPTSRHPSCLPVPAYVTDFHLVSHSDAGSPASPDPPFLLLWSTGAKSFTLRARRCIESIFYHHPHATVLVYSNQLPLDFFREFLRLHFDIRVRRYSLAKLLAHTPAEGWMAHLAEWQRGPYYYSHVTDVLRLALLFHVGGAYLDFDVIVTRRMHFPETFDSFAPRSPGMRPLFNSIGIESNDGLVYGRQVELEWTGASDTSEESMQW
ncbi:MAG: hypothetical protein SGPRY_001986 [Prymnesium sp.]